ncbi:MAG: hypothetical protein SVX38_16340, partial [Chloroflexota bacterium]|nr:hypothetical protein [Chloroflexota bacterium]
MTDLLNSPARPIIVLLLGALAIGLLDRLSRPRDRGILLVLLVADGALALLSLSTRLPLHIVLGQWRDLPLLGCDWGLGMDNLAFLFAAAMLCVALALSVAAVGHPPIPRAPLLVLLAAGLGLIFSADLIALSASGFILDMAFAWAVISVDGTERGFRPATWMVGMGGLANLTLLTAALTLCLDGDFPALDGVPSSPLALLLVTVAALARLGIYPLYFWLPRHVEGSQVARAWLHLIPVATGLWLPTHAYVLAQGAWPWPVFLLILGGVGFLAAAVLAWGETQPARVLSWVILAQLGYGLVLITLGTSPLPVAINLLLGAGLLFVGPSFTAIWRRVSTGWGRWHWAVEIPSAVGVGMLAGVPGSLGLVGRIVLYRALLNQGPMSLLAASLLAESLLVAALLRAWLAHDFGAQETSTSTDHPLIRWSLLIAVVMLVAAGLIVGFHPPLLVRSLAGGVTLPSLFTLLRGTTLAQAAAIILPLVGGVALHLYQVETYDLNSSFDSKGILVTHNAVKELNRIFIDSLSRKGLPI